MDGISDEYERGREERWFSNRADLSVRWHCGIRGIQSLCIVNHKEKHKNKELEPRYFNLYMLTCGVSTYVVREQLGLMQNDN